jgi:hypothetical protein
MVHARVILEGAVAIRPAREDDPAVDDAEALKLLMLQLEEFRKLSHPELVERFLDRYETMDATGPSGTTYELEFQAFWEDEQTRALRVLGSVDDGQVRAFVPLSDSFVVVPESG